MFNPMQLMQMMKSGNQQQMVQQLMGNSQLMQNPIAKTYSAVTERTHLVLQTTTLRQYQSQAVCLHT